MDGTNNYSISKQTPTEVIVSRTLQAKNRAWSNVIWRTGKPPLDSEWNLINDMVTETVSSLIRANGNSGWLELGLRASMTPVANSVYYYSGNGNSIDIPNAVINGWPLIIGGVNYTDTSKNKIVLPAASTSARWDFVFLEVWRTMVRSRDANNIPISYHKPNTTTVYAYGNTQFGGTNFTDDIVDSAIKPSVNGIETSERVQLQYRIRTVSGVSFANVLTDGFADTTKVQGQGAATNPQGVGYDFVNMKTTLGDAGLWRAGTGDDASRTALESVDGYTYAIPMFKVFRRNTTAWDNASNQDGNSAILSSGTSDRPDGKFNDGIDSTDIIDLRYKTSLTGMDYTTLLEKNLHKLLSGSLITSKVQKLQYDLVADANVAGYTDFLSNEGCSGKRAIWSDTATVQTNVFAEVKIDTAAIDYPDAYRETNIGLAWQAGDIIHLSPTTKIVGGVISTDTPKIYVENNIRTDITSQGTWSPSNKTWTISNTAGLGSRNLWINYDISLPEGRGLSHVSDEGLRIDYTNYTNFPIISSNPGGGGYVVTGSRHDPITTRFQDFIDHPISVNGVSEVSFVPQRKQFTFTPLIRTATSSSRKLQVVTTTGASKKLYTPYPIMHLKGVYTLSTGGVEVATTTVGGVVKPTSISTTDDSLTITGSYICELTSVLYSSNGSFSSPISVLADYGPVYEHSSTGTKVRFYKKLAPNAGAIWDITDSDVTHWRYSGRTIPVSNGSVYGMTMGGNLINCIGSTNNMSFPGSNESELWLDMDYYGAPHKGAELRIIYKYTPYQGMDVGGMTVRMISKRDKGLVYNNGTGGGTIDTTGSTGTSNYNYTPMSVKLPGDGLDYNFDGTLIEIKSSGNLRKDSDAFFFVGYELYGYHGGGALFNMSDFTLPSPETSTRGFLSVPYLKAMFEQLEVSQSNATYLLPLLVKNTATDELFMMVQTCDNNGAMLDSPVRIELYRLDEKLLVK